MSAFRVILVCIFPAFPHIRTEYGEILGENAGKMRTRITPNTDTFYAMMGKSNPSKTEKTCKETKTNPNWKPKPIIEKKDTIIIESIIKMKTYKKNKTNIYQVLTFIHRIKINTAPITFYSHFNEVNC